MKLTSIRELVFYMYDNNISSKKYDSGVEIVKKELSLWPLVM